MIEEVFFISSENKQLRADGRAYDELRPIKIKAGVLKRADGSAYVEVGGNKILASVYGPRETYIRRLLKPNTGVIKVRYNMAPFSVDDRKRPGPDRRSNEISKIAADALRPALMLESFPRSMVDISIEIIEAEGGTRCAGITAAAVALADAGIPMRDIPVGCAAGKMNGDIVLDLSEKEDKEGQADVPIVILPRTGEITLLQADGKLTEDEFEEALDLAMEGCMRISKIHKWIGRVKMNVVPEISKRSIVKLINNGKRADGRDFDQRREIVVEPGIISKAEGSAKVTLGDTQVIVGVKPSIGEPFADTPDVGVLMTNCEMLPMAAPEFEPGPPSPESIELARVVDRGIRESELVDLEKLCIEEGKKVWMLFIDLHVIDYDGNLFDCANIAVMAALLNTKLPTASIVDDELVLDEENLMDLPVRDKVALSTFVKIGNGMVLDPSLEEEEVLDARLSVGVTQNNSYISSMQKGGEVPLTRDEILDAVHTAIATKDEIYEYLE